MAFDAQRNGTERNKIVAIRQLIQSIDASGKKLATIAKEYIKSKDNIVFFISSIRPRLSILASGLYSLLYFLFHTNIHSMLDFFKGVTNEVSQFFHNRTFTSEYLDHYLYTNDLNRESLTNFTVPDGFTAIGEWTFSGYRSLTHVELPDSLNEIGKFAFSGCSALESVKLPAGINIINALAFQGCTSLKMDYLPDSLTEIHGNAFENCTSLSIIKLSGKLDEVQVNAFKGCTNLNNIVTNRTFDWAHIGIKTEQTSISTYSEHLQQSHLNLKINMQNIEDKEAYFIDRTLHNQICRPSWDILKNTFSNRSFKDVYDLVNNLKIDHSIVPNISIEKTNTGAFIPFDECLEYLTIIDCCSLFNNNEKHIIIYPSKTKNPENAPNNQSNPHPPLPHIQRAT